MKDGRTDAWTDDGWSDGCMDRLEDVWREYGQMDGRRRTNDGRFDERTERKRRLDRQVEC